MSKKKAASAMSLKDFHGGSIPSDLPLPSAPGVLMKSGSDRNMSANWGNNLLGSDLRPRPKSSGTIHNLDEKASVLSHPAPIGRNFDEDERKPLNGVLAPRQTISTLPPVHREMKADYVSSVRVSDRSVSSPSSVASSSPLRVGGGNYFTVNSQTPVSSNGQSANNLNTTSGNNGQGVNSSRPNAWGIRKEVMAVEETTKSPVLLGPDTSTKIAQASALEKVSSGMWQSKNPSQLLPHLAYSRGNNSNVSGGLGVVSERAAYDASSGSQVERGQVAEDGTKDGGRELSRTYREEVHIRANSGESLLAPAPPPEISERLKLKLLPRSGQLKTSENGYRQGYQQSTVTGRVESVNDLSGNMNSPKPGPGATVATEAGSQMVERPKLNLKPRSQPLDQSDRSLERERQTLFGGARPRELILKERGLDETAISNLDLGNVPNRVSSPKNEVTSERLVPSTAYHQNTTENISQERRSWRNVEKKEQQMGRGKDDNEGRNRRIEGRSGSRHSEKQQDERPEPDTWRKAVEEPTQNSEDSSGIHQGKIVSALDLAQAFSKSVSNPKTPEQQRGMPGNNNQMPFSRLTKTGERSSLPTTRLSSF